MINKKFIKGIIISTIAFNLINSLGGCSLSLKQKALETTTSVTTTIQVIRDEIEKVENGLTDAYIKENPEEYAKNITSVTKDTVASYGYELVECTLVRVVDGDTLVVNINDEETKIRLIGINTPESVASKEYLDKTGKENTAEGKAASEWVKDFLAIGQTLYLQKDTSETDKYGRSLRYVWIDIPSDCDNIKEIQSKMLNGILLENGLAEVTIYKPDTKYADEFQAISTHTTDDFEIDR